MWHPAQGPWDPLQVQGDQAVGHVPYRDSKLTKLLMDSIGGASLCLVVACVTPASHQREETLNTLQYATRAKRIVNRPCIQVDTGQSEFSMLQQELRVLRNENEYLRSIVVRTICREILCWCERATNRRIMGTWQNALCWQSGVTMRHSLVLVHV